jgi:hypothetical protein
MKNRRNKNAPPTTTLVQYYIDTAYDVVKAVYDNLAGILLVGEAIESGVLEPKDSKSLIVENPTISEDLSFFFTDIPITVTKVRAVLVGATPSVTWSLRHGIDRSITGVEVITGGTTTTEVTTGVDIIVFDDPSIIANSHIWFETTAKSGTIESIILTLFYDED